MYIIRSAAGDELASHAFMREQADMAVDDLDTRIVAGRDPNLN